MTDSVPAPLLSRARCFVLASLVLEYPQEELVDTCDTLAQELTDHEGLGPLAEAARQGLQALQAGYGQLFESGKGRVSLYETEHGRMRGASKGKELADIAGFYLAFFLTLDDERVHEMLDHVAVELEFYGHLLLKQHVLEEKGDREGTNIVESARRKFLTDHLGRFVSAIAAQPPVQENVVYGPALRWCARLVEHECELLHIEPAPLDFYPDLGERDDTSCGAVRLPVLN